VDQRDGLTDEHSAIAYQLDLREILGEEMRHLAAVAMLAAATPEKDQFVQLGLGETFIADLTQAITEFDDGTETAHGARSTHVGATKRLIAVSGDSMRLVGVLDGLNRARFRDDPALHAAWESAKHVAGPLGAGARTESGAGSSSGRFCCEAREEDRRGVGGCAEE
jgi:hypothetical protein